MLFRSEYYTKICEAFDNSMNNNTECDLVARGLNRALRQCQV